jgi:hypothetical protein
MATSVTTCLNYPEFGYPREAPYTVEVVSFGEIGDYSFTLTGP